ncbi:MAG: terpene cyclase/mutase family protein [Planctomycetes bacterium]|nr:terpene cyclase/mutase family protein [Planctomycetota bacterium]
MKRPMSPRSRAVSSEKRECRWEWILVAILFLARPVAAAEGLEILDETFPDGVRVRCEVASRGDGRRFLNGFYCRWDAGGEKVCFGQYRDGERDGKWKVRSPGGAWEERSYGNGFLAGTVVSAGSRASDRKPHGDASLIVARQDVRGNNTAEGCLLGGLPHDVWVFYREDGSRLFEGTYWRGVPEGVWVAYLADGRIEPALISGVYAQGRRVADLPPWEPRVRFGATATPGPVAPLPVPENPAIASTIATVFAKGQSGRTSHEAMILSGDPATVPHVLNALLALDLATEEGRRRADLAEELLLRPLFAGNDLPCGGILSGASEQDVRLAVLRWRLVWEVVRDKPMCLLVDIPLAKATLASSGENVLALVGPPSDAPPERNFSARAQKAEQPISKAVAAGLDWLARHQEEDGRFDCRDFSSRCGSGACDGEGNIYDVGTTALAVLAFLGDPSAKQRAHHEERVARAARWLIKSLDPSTGRFQSIEDHYVFEDGTTGCALSPRGNIESAVAVMALCEAATLFRSPVCAAAAQRGVDYLLSARNPYKAWGDDWVPAGNNNMSTTGFCLLALVEAREAGLVVDPAAFEGVMLFISEMTDENSWRTGWVGKGGYSARQPGLNKRWPEKMTEAMTALAMVCRILMGEDPQKSVALRGGADLLRMQLPFWDEKEGTIDYIYWMFGAHAMWQMGGADWEMWQKRMFDAVVKTQRQDGCERGSWDPQYDPWGHEGGRIYATAMMLLALEAPGRYVRSGS